jgi:hypothetical protein
MRRVVGARVEYRIARVERARSAGGQVQNLELTIGMLPNASQYCGAAPTDQSQCHRSLTPTKGVLRLCTGTSR